MSPQNVNHMGNEHIPLGQFPSHFIRRGQWAFSNDYVLQRFITGYSNANACIRFFVHQKQNLCFLNSLKVESQSYLKRLAYLY